MRISDWSSDVCSSDLIADLRLANRGEEDLEDLVLTLLVDPPLIAEKRWRIDRLPAGGELRLRDRKVSLSGAILSRLTDKRRAELFLRLTRGDELIAEEPREIAGLRSEERRGGQEGVRTGRSRVARLP